MAGRLNLTVDQGSTFVADLTWDIDGDPVDLTTYTARMQVRERVAADTVVLDLADGSGITLGGVEGTVAIEFTAAQTAALSPRRYVYDLELIAGAYVKRLVQGSITVKPEVTR